MAEYTEFDLPTNSYAAFDAQSMRDLIIDRLNNNSNVSFTDQNFEGSNLNAIIDVIAYSFHTLMFYLNQTSSETMFTDAQLYENMNRIVKLIDYKPTGKQTAIAPMDIKASSGLGVGYYTIPRMSFVTANGKTYSTIKDISFRKTITGIETVTPITGALFYEGKYKEYPTVRSNGEEFQTVTLLPGENVNVDHFSIKVFVRETFQNETKWFEYDRTASLFLSNPNSRTFECRLNPNKNYEIKFGNGINGKRLKLNDEIAIYYIASTGASGEISKNNFNSTTLNIFNTTKFDTIYSDTKDSSLTYLTVDQSVNVTLSNSEASTSFSEEETVEEIRNNAPKFFSSEYKLVTKPDYESFVNRNFRNIIYDVKVSNNSDYLNVFTKYLTDDLGLNSYSEFNNALYNQYEYSDSFNVNNIYYTIVPKFKKENSIVTRSNYISNALKQEIVNEVRKYKLLNAEISFVDPVYMATNFFTKNSSEPNKVEHTDNTRLYILRNSNTIINDNTIKNKVLTILKNYFDNAKLGMLFDIQLLNKDITSIEGVESIYTFRTDTGQRTDGLNIGVYNPIYNGRDLKYYNSNFTFKYFQLPYVENYENLRGKIIVQPINKSNTLIEY
jgi:hypothetical protein